MSDYNRIYNLTVKDSLPSGDSGKIIKGAELDAELNAVSAAIASKSDINSPTFTGTPAAPTAAAGTNTTQIATTAFVKAAVEAMWPVGSIFIAASFSGVPFSFGTWEEYAQGRVLVGYNSSDTSFNTMGATGGSKDATVVSHTHTLSSAGTAASGGAHTHSITDPGHFHEQNGQTLGPGAGSYAFGSGSFAVPVNNTDSKTTGISINSGGAHTHTLSGSTDSAGSSGTNANLQPYLVVKFWRRTA